jgi:Set1/Ash2 histone methyltransferase complex subunit ASH2
MTTRRRAAEGDIAPAAKAAKLRASARNSSMGECDENNARVAALRRVRLCIVDGPTHFSVYKSKLTVKGEKGYRMIRATHGVQEGSMYYEVRFNAQDPVIIPGGDHPPTSLPPASKGHIRVGWSREKGDIDVPVGFDEFSYGFGDAQGRRFHRSLARPYAAPFHPGDVIGCLVTLPVVGRDGDGDGEGETAELGSPRDSAVVEADRLLADLKDQFKRQFTTLHGSHISFYLNGEPLGRAFESIPGGPYFPAVSLYNGASVTVNFGPDFEYPPFDNLFTERSAAVECTVDANQLAAVTVVAATPLNSGPNSGPSSGSAGNNGGGGGNYSSSAGGSGSASAGSGTGTGSSSSSSGGNNNSNSGSSGSSGTNAAYSLGLPPGSVHGSGSGLSSGNRHGGAEGSGDGGDGDSSGTLMSLPFIGYLSDVAAWARPQIKPAVGLGDEECSVFAATDAADGEGIIETLKKQLAMKKAKRSGASHRKDTKKRGKKPTSAAAPLLPTGSEDGAGAGADEEDGDADAGAAMTDSAGPGSSPTATSATAATAAGAADAAAAAACAGAGGGAAAAAAAAAAAEKKEKGRALARTIVYRRRQRVYPVLVPNPRLEDEPDW